MAWISINPDCEPYYRKSAAMALASNPSNLSANLCLVLNHEIDPLTLAGLYNNAENLGLDLYSLGKQSPFEVSLVKMSALATEHKDFLDRLKQAALTDIAENDLEWESTRRLIWSYNPMDRDYDL